MDFQGVSWSDSGLHHDMHDMPYASELQYLKFDARSVWISRKWQEMEWNEQPQVIHQIYDHCQLSSHSDYPRGGWKNNLGLSQQELSFSQQICETSRAILVVKPLIDWFQTGDFNHGDLTSTDLFQRIFAA